MYEWMYELCRALHLIHTYIDLYKYLYTRVRDLNESCMCLYKNSALRNSYIYSYMLIYIRICVYVGMYIPVCEGHTAVSTQIITWVSYVCTEI